MPEFKATVEVMLKPTVLDPQGRAVERTLQRLGHRNVRDLRIGKRIELVLEGEREAVAAQLEELAREILSNPVTEGYRVELNEV